VVNAHHHKFDTMPSESRDWGPVHLGQTLPESYEDVDYVLWATRLYFFHSEGRLIPYENPYENYSIEETIHSYNWCTHAHRRETPNGLIDARPNHLRVYWRKVMWPYIFDLLPWPVSCDQFYIKWEKDLLIEEVSKPFTIHYNEGDIVKGYDPVDIYRSQFPGCSHLNYAYNDIRADNMELCLIGLDLRWCLWYDVELESTEALTSRFGSDVEGRNRFEVERWSMLYQICQIRLDSGLLEDGRPGWFRRRLDTGYMKGYFCSDEQYHSPGSVRDFQGMRPLPGGLSGVQLHQHREWLQRRRDAGLRPGIEDTDDEHSDDETNSDEESLFSHHEMDTDGDGDGDADDDGDEADIGDFGDNLLSPRSVMEA